VIARQNRIVFRARNAGRRWNMRPEPICCAAAIAAMKTASSSPTPPIVEQDFRQTLQALTNTAATRDSIAVHCDSCGASYSFDGFRAFRFMPVLRRSRSGEDRAPPPIATPGVAAVPDRLAIKPASRFANGSARYGLRPASSRIMPATISV
jgi:hypothetical protein